MRQRIPRVEGFNEKYIDVFIYVLKLTANAPHRIKGTISNKWYSLSYETWNNTIFPVPKGSDI